MHRIYYLLQNQNTAPSIYEIITFLATLAAVGLSIWQSVLARRALQLAQEAIADDIKARQLSMLPEMSGVILVQMHINRWIERLEKIERGIIGADKEKNNELLEKIANSGLKSPRDVGVDKFFYEKMTPALKEILMSAAQYYYNTECIVRFLRPNPENRDDWNFIPPFLERSADSLAALKKLKGLISDLVPGIILHTPASINSDEFLEDR